MGAHSDISIHALKARGNTAAALRTQGRCGRLLREWPLVSASRREVQHPPPLCQPCWSWLSMCALGKLRESTSVMLCNRFSPHCPLRVPPIDMKRFWVTRTLTPTIRFLKLWSFYLCQCKLKKKKRKKRTFHFFCIYPTQVQIKKKTYWGFSNLD